MQTKASEKFLTSKSSTSVHSVDIEEAVDLSNRFIGSCQRVVDRVEKKSSTFYARAFDIGRNSVSRDGSHGDPVDTFPLFLEPKKLYAHLNGFGEEEENGATPQTVALDYLKEGLRAWERDKDRGESNTGDLIAMFLQERREQRAYEMTLQKQNREIIQEWASTVRESTIAMAAMIRDKEGQELSREITKLKIDGLREGAKLGKNFLTGVVPGFGGSQPTANVPNVPGSGESRVVTTMTRERTLIDTFFNDCTNAKIADAIFGKYEPGPDGKAMQTQPGIFTIEQFFIFGRVHGGYATADALDDLLPDSGKPVAVTMEQLTKAQALEGMTQSIGISLATLFKIRTAAREEARRQAQTPPPSSTSPEPAKENDDVI